MKGSTSNPLLPARPQPFANMPISRKLMLIIMVVTTAALATSGIALMVTDSQLFRGSLTRDLTVLAGIVADNSTAALSFDDPQAAGEMLSALRARTHLTAACIYRSDGRLFARYTRTGDDAPCQRPAGGDGVRYAEGDMTVSRGIILQGQRIGSLILRYDLAESTDRMWLYGSYVLAILVISALVALLLTSRLRRVIATPISELARTSAAVSRTQDYRIRAQKLSEDELGVLVDVFNSMLEGIESRDQDLTQALLAREGALNEARAARDLLRTTLASIGDAVVSTDAGGAIVFANAVASRLLRTPEDQMEGRRVEDVLRLVDEQTGEPVESSLAQALRQGAVRTLGRPILLTAGDGSKIPIDDSAAPIRGPHGELIGAVLVFRDITERRRAERELHAAREQLQMVTDTMAPAVAHCSRELRFLWVSRRYAEWLRTDPEEMAGREIREVLGEEAFVAMHGSILRVLEGERVDYQAQVMLPRIGRRWIRSVCVPSHDQSGAVTGWVEDVTDITDLKEAQAEVARINADLKRSNESLARSNEDLARFAYAASHDLQEPLRMITTYTQLLGRALPAEVMDGQPKVYIQNVVDGALRMRALLTDLLSYSEIGGIPDEPVQRVDLNLVLETVRQNLKVAIEESAAVIESCSLPVVAGQSGHFVQLFQNLVSNAIKYRSERPPRISITAHECEGLWRIELSDNGLGIAPEYHTKIFGVFKRLHGRKIPGTGIGLAICQRVVERYGGRIWVESQNGAGAKFIFTVPADQGSKRGIE